MSEEIIKLNKQYEKNGVRSLLTLFIYVMVTII